MQVPIDEHGGSDGNGDVERFEEVKLDTGEIARFLIPVRNATAFYVHELKPILIEGGKIVPEKRQRRDKSWFEVKATGFLGRKICTGVVELDGPDGTKQPGPMRVKGIDPENCIICAACAGGIADLKPELRYAVPIIRISTRSKASTDIADPPSVKVLVLPLTRRQYKDMSTALGGIRELYGWGPDVPIAPNMADLVIECEDGSFKRYKWLPPMRPHWAKDPGTGQVRNPDLASVIARTWKNPDNRPTPEQLQASCGKAGDLVFLQQDLDEVVESYAQAKAIERGEKLGTAPAAADRGPDADLTAGLDGLDEILGDPPAQPAAGAVPDDLSGLDEFASPEQKAGGAAREAPGEPAGTDDLFGTDEPGTAPAAAQSAPATAPAGAPGTFDDLMGDL
jgi:NAD-dependent dihydropyrimidine dehydrogenase PreA subunit